MGSVPEQVKRPGRGYGRVPGGTYAAVRHWICGGKRVWPSPPHDLAFPLSSTLTRLHPAQVRVTGRRWGWRCGRASARGPRPVGLGTLGGSGFPSCGARAVLLSLLSGHWLRPARWPSVAGWWWSAKPPGPEGLPAVGAAQPSPARFSRGLLLLSGQRTATKQEPTSLGPLLLRSSSTRYCVDAGHAAGISNCWRLEVGAPGLRHHPSPLRGASRAGPGG